MPSRCWSAPAVGGGIALIVVSTGYPCAVGAEHYAPQVRAALEVEGEPDLEGQREDFLRAERALEQGRLERFTELRQSLQDYPLYPYLEYARIRHRLGAHEAIERFLLDHDGSALAARLRRAWLAKLASQGQWQQFLAHYRPSEDAAMRCRRLRALIETGEVGTALAQVAALWLVGVSQPQACDPVFARWMKEGGLSAELAWQRVRLAMQAGRPGLARYLSRFLDSDRAKLAAAWRRAHTRASALLEVAALPGSMHEREEVLVHAMHRLARRDASKAASMWPKLDAQFVFESKARHTIVQRIALYLALEHDARALVWFDAVPEAALDALSREWRIAAALLTGQWDRALRHICAEPQTGVQASRWRYWRARALEALGARDEAEPHYRAAAAERSYYGFLAAERLGQAYQLGDRALEVPAERLATLVAEPAARRARELLRLGRRVDARREWAMLTRDMDDAQLAAAAQIAHLWAWHPVAILTAARSSDRDDLSLRFPLAHREPLMAEATAQGLDPAWLFAVVRQESAFMPDARSPAGALGLMQIMPATARAIAKSLGTTAPSRTALIDPALSARFGAKYLRDLLDRFNGQAVLASAAYNAGPHRVRRWRKAGTAVPADIWIENVPFRETRSYLRRVLAYIVIYEYRLGGPPTGLSDRLSPISPQ